MTTTSIPGALERAPAVPPLMACPSCHTALTDAADVEYQSGRGWQCDRCGQQWTASRLATVAEYEAWDRKREHAP